jgi:hypothetical protein
MTAVLRRRSVRFLFAAAVASLVLSTRIASAETIYVFLIGGQSNAEGRALASDLPLELRAPREDIPFYYASLTTLRPASVGRFGLGDKQMFGPEVTFGRSMAAFAARFHTKIALIKQTTGGTNLYAQWVAGGDATTAGDGPAYVKFQTMVGKGLEALQAANPDAKFVLAGMIWMQGESDVGAHDGDQSGNYQRNLTAFINDIRLTYGANLPFVIGQLSANQTGVGPTEQRETVRAAQKAVAASLPNTALVDTDQFELKPDHTHFTATGQQALGAAFAEKMQSLLSASHASVTR